MTSEILDQVLTMFNNKINCEKKSVLLFMDNAGWHPEDLKKKVQQCKNYISAAKHNL